MSIINEVDLGNGRKIRLWGKSSVIPKKVWSESKGRRRRMKKGLERKCFYTYDADGKEIYESKRVFSEQKGQNEQNILAMKCK
jgi:hypothetical protein